MVEPSAASGMCLVYCHCEWKMAKVGQKWLKITEIS
jgi:hypothetical protein